MDRKTQISTSVTIGASIAALLVGCGGGSGESSTSTPPTKAQFLKNADQICEERLKEKDRVLKGTLKQFSPAEIANPSKEKLEELGQSVLPPFKKLISEIDELPAPPKDKGAVNSIIDSLDEGMEKAEADPSKLATVDPFEDAT